MKLIVGGYYVTRNGETVKIESAGADADFPFNGSNGHSYTGDGRYWCEAGRIFHSDLIREATTDEVIAFEAKRDASFPTVDEVVDAEFEKVPHVGRDKTASEIEANQRTYADLFDAPPADESAPWSKAGLRIEQARRFRDFAHGIMSIMLGIAAILFSASAYVA